MNEKRFCFTVDDNIRFLKELTEGSFGSLFEHPYLMLYRNLHSRFDLKVQFNLFWQTEGFTLRQMTDRYRSEWEENAHWLKLSFHSERENVDPYRNAPYEEVRRHCEGVHREILRFAGEASLARTTTVHYCLATHEGLRALKDCGVKGLLGLYGTAEKPRLSYQTSPSHAERIRQGATVTENGISYAAIDLILNTVSLEEIPPRLETVVDHNTVRTMIHEQYFYPDYPRYQREFAQKLESAFQWLVEKGYHSVFFEETLREEEA